MGVGVGVEKDPISWSARRPGESSIYELVGKPFSWDTAFLAFVLLSSLEHRGTGPGFWPLNFKSRQVRYNEDIRGPSRSVVYDQESVPFYLTKLQRY